MEFAWWGWIFVVALLLLVDRLIKIREDAREEREKEIFEFNAKYKLPFDQIPAAYPKSNKNDFSIRSRTSLDQHKIRVAGKGGKR